MVPEVNWHIGRLNSLFMYEGSLTAGTGIIGGRVSLRGPVVGTCICVMDRSIWMEHWIIVQVSGPRRTSLEEQEAR